MNQSKISIKTPGRILGSLVILALVQITTYSGASVLDASYQPRGHALENVVHNRLRPDDEDASMRIVGESNGTLDWMQVQRDPQRTGYTPEVLRTNFQVAWTHSFQPEKIHPQVQAIVYEGEVFVGTEMGNLYALDALTGNDAWMYNVGSPILNSVAADDGRIYFGAMDGAVYALDVGTGSLLWKSPLSWRLGFSTAPLIADGKVMLGGRDGVFYALDLATGETLWDLNVGAPILQTAAWHNGRAFVGAMDMHVYAIDTAAGTLAWSSERLPGLAFKDYWPVAHQGRVLVRSMSISEGLYVLDQATGDTMAVLAEHAGKVQHGATTPPAVDRDGYLIVPIPKLDGTYGSCWGRLDLAAQQVVDSLETGGCGNSDESENVSTSYNLIIGLHTIDTPGAGFSGYFDLDSRNWTTLYSGTDHQPRYNTQGGGGNAPSISNGMLYHISLHYITAWSAY